MTMTRGAMRSEVNTLVVLSKGEHSVLFGSGGNKNHKYSCNNRLKREMSAKRKADRTDIIAETMVH